MFFGMGVSLQSQKVTLQSQKNELKVELLSSNEPVKMVSFAVGDITLKSGEKFDSSDDWLNNLQINVENTSRKTATHISFGLLFLRSDEQKDVPPAHYSIRRGNKSEALKGLDSGFKIKSNANKGKRSVSLFQEEYEGIRSFLNKFEMV